jgi:hypothetical protein
MPPDVLQRAFEPFCSTKGPAKGTGLGLSTVYVPLVITASAAETPVKGEARCREPREPLT